MDYCGDASMQGGSLSVFDDLMVNVSKIVVSKYQSENKSIRGKKKNEV